MRIFLNRGIRAKLVLMVALPLFGFGYLLLASILSSVGVVRDMGTLSEFASYAGGVSQVVHELQRERGTTSGFLGGDGTTFRAELVEQRKATDRRIEELRGVVTALDASKLGAEFTASLRKTQGQLDQLASQRTAILERKIPASQAIAFYTSLIDTFFTDVSLGTQQINHPEIAPRLIAYANVMRAKEQAGIERATLSNAFAEDRFQDGFLVREASVVAGQDLFLKSFQLSATPEHRTLYESRVRGHEVDEVLRLRQDALARFAEPSLGNVDPKQWFAVATARIDLMKAVEDELAGDVLARAQALNAAAWTHLYLMLAVGMSLLLVTVGLSLLISADIRNGVRAVQLGLNDLAVHGANWLADALHNLANGDLSERPRPAVARVHHATRDELGEMAATANDLHDRMVQTMDSYEQARRDLSDIVSRISRSATTVADTSARMSQSSTETSHAVEQVGQAMQSIAAGSSHTSEQAQVSSAAIIHLTDTISQVARAMDDQAEHVHTVTNTAVNMAANVDHVTTTARLVAAASVETTASVARGDGAVREISAAMANIQTVNGQAAENVERLGRLGERIGAVVETIDDIADQTNLLALNAAIEAARAGEQGRGFAIVADEVRKLAERSRRETHAVSELVHEIQMRTRDAVSAMSSGTHAIETGVDRADQAMAELENIRQVVESNAAQVTAIARAAEEINDGARSVAQAMELVRNIVDQCDASAASMASQSNTASGAMESIAAVAEENSAATEEVSASAQEMAVQVELVSMQARGLAATADGLRQLVHRFTLDGLEDGEPDGLEGDCYVA
ncbi:MAG: nitrate- and nitrite sensing domain-containing protein [Chloroflexota bacterium]